MKVRRAASAIVCAAMVLACGGQTLRAQVVPGGNGPPQYPPPQQSPLPAAPPFQPSPQEQAALDPVLKAWETESGKIKTFNCIFTHWVYDKTFPPPGNPQGPQSTSKGEIAYEAPDKGMLREDEVESWKLNPTTQKLEWVKTAYGEHWACDGKSVFQVDHEHKIVHETRLPPEMQGQSITDGPLPFAFGAQADKLKARYYMQLTTPAANAGTEVWLKILPRFQKDAANFLEIEVILRASDMRPQGIQITRSKTYREVFFFEKKTNPLIPSFFDKPFAPSPLGYKHVVEQTGPPPAGNGQPGGNPPPGNNPQVRRPLPPNSPGYR